VAQAVAAVGRDVDVEEPVVDAEGALRRRPQRGRIIGGQDDDAVVVVAQAELILGAQHARRLDALDRLDAEGDPARQGRARPRPQHLAAGLGDIRGAAHHLGGGAIPLGDHVDQGQLLRLRVGALGHHLRHDDAGEAGAQIGRTFDLEAAAGQRGDALVDGRDLGEIAQLEKPGPQSLHGSLAGSIGSAR
jgi:hypothetical protein